MTLKIDRISGKRRTLIRLSGALRSEHCDQVKAEIQRGLNRRRKGLTARGSNKEDSDATGSCDDD